MKVPLFSKTMSVGSTTETAAFDAAVVRAEIDDRNFLELRRREAGGGKVFADAEHRLDFARVDFRRERGELRRRQFLDQAGDERSANVGIAIGGKKNPVALPHPADEPDRRVQRIGKTSS